jgi:uncharacterized protein (DUF2141 family)
MSNFMCFATVFLAASMLQALSAFAAEDSRDTNDGHELTVEVTDVKGKDGKLLILLFSKLDGFPDDTSKAAHTARIDIDQPRHTFSDLSASRYVVVVIHDRDNNGKADNSGLGFPKEPIGLRNHKKLAPPRPDFEKAKVNLKATKEINVNIIQVGP